MKVAKKIFIGSMILLLITTPILVSAGVNKNTHPLSLNVSEYNSLGTAILKHQPLLRTIFTDKGLVTNYEEPVGNLLYDYYFPEDENGSVNLNFTLYVKHLVNPISIYWAKFIWPEHHRSSGITLWINFNGEEYCYDRSVTDCNNSPDFQYYNISIKGLKPLVTNGENKTGILYINAWPAITPISFFQILCERFFSDKVVQTDITIHPY